jgi:hypothetical protein
MKRSKWVLICLILAISTAAGGAPPQIQFAAGGATLTDVQPGTSIAWMALVLDRANYQEKVKVFRGVDVATQGRTLKIAAPNDRSGNAIWTFATVDADIALTAATPSLNASTRAVEVEATEGATSLVIKGARSEVLFVRRGAAWTFSGADGGPKDADNSADGRITMTLNALASLHGNRPAPQAIEKGDLILVIDFTTRRSSAIRVSR